MHSVHDDAGQLVKAEKRNRGLRIRIETVSATVLRRQRVTRIESEVRYRWKMRGFAPGISCILWTAIIRNVAGCEIAKCVIRAARETRGGGDRWSQDTGERAMDETLLISCSVPAFSMWGTNVPYKLHRNYKKTFGFPLYTTEDVVVVVAVAPPFLTCRGGHLLKIVLLCMSAKNWDSTCPY